MIVLYYNNTSRFRPGSVDCSPERRCHPMRPCWLIVAICGLDSSLNCVRCEIVGLKIGKARHSSPELSGAPCPTPVSTQAPGAHVGSCSSVAGRSAALGRSPRPGRGRSHHAAPAGPHGCVAGALSWAGMSASHRRPQVRVASWVVTIDWHTMPTRSRMIS